MSGSSQHEKRATRRRGNKEQDNERDTRWRRNKELRGQAAGGCFLSVTELDASIADFVARHFLPGWPQVQAQSKVRGPDLVRKLLWLAHEFNDKRFIEAVTALIERQIVDGGYNFTGKRGPNFADLERQESAAKRQRDSDYVAQVHALVEQKNMSVRLACDEVAVATGYPGESRRLAGDSLRKLYQKTFPPKKRP
jgi:hypothetical protein